MVVIELYKNNQSKYMNYKINILIHNKHGELVDKQFSFNSLDEMRNLDINKLVNEAEDFGRENGMLIEELYDSKEDVVTLKNI